MAGREALAPNEPSTGEQPTADGGALAEGTTLDGRYTLLGVLGRGGMATVYRARDRRLDRSVALKVLDSAGEIAEATAAREDRLTAALAHPNIVTVYDSGTTPDGRPFLVLELLAGRPASQLAPLPIAQALAIAEQIAAALEHAHARGIVHCDVKPQNVLIDHAGRATLTDFGVASAEAAPVGKAVYGAAAYLAPERLRGAAANPAVDLYALGATLYSLIAGCPPYAERGDVVARVLAGPPPPLEMVVPSVPPPVAALVGRALAADPDARFPDAASMRRAITAARETLPRPRTGRDSLGVAFRNARAQLGRAAGAGGRTLLRPRTARLGLVAFLLLALLASALLPRPRDEEVQSAADSAVPTATALAEPLTSARAASREAAAARAIPPSSGGAAGVAAAPIRVEATISDPTPRRSARLTITGRLLRGDTGIAGVPMRTVWHFRSGKATCDQRAGTDEAGRASCVFSMSGAFSGHEVVVDVLFDYEGQTYQTQVRFTPQ